MRNASPRPYRRYTMAQIKAVKGWKCLRDLCRELGIPIHAGRYIREQYKRP